MAIDKLRLKDALRDLLDNKLSKLQFEPSKMPFQTAILGDRRMVSYSYCHSISTTIGSFHETVASVIATSEFDVVRNQVTLPTTITKGAQSAIEEIINDLSTGRRVANHKDEIEILRHECIRGEVDGKKNSKVDVWLERENVVYMIDLKTAKPNKDGWVGMKRNLLTWAAKHLYVNPKAEIRSIIGIPYNPFDPEPYKFPMNFGTLDVDSPSKQVMVGKELWQFLSGTPNAQAQILACYIEVGEEKQEEIERVFTDIAITRSVKDLSSTA